MTAALMTAKEASALTGLTESILADWRARGIGPRSFRLGTRVVYRRVEIEAWLAAQASRSES